MRYAYNGTAPVGSRIVAAVLEDGQPIAEVPEIVAIVTNYMAAGSDG